MSSDVAIEVKDLTKTFHIYNKPQDRLKQMAFFNIRQFYDEYSAISDITFKINKGETVGIVGCNGSGKSTLLQLICNILAPTSGYVCTNGRIAALLELGSGFNPEFTGRENVYFNASILGLSKAEINDKYEEIVTFADIGSFIEQPVKTYSSGMMMRLAFAVAINVDPQILVIDEALAVGDELFQRKCFARIQTIKENGATILFVSHSGSTVIDLCDRAMLIHAGSLVLSGTPKFVISRYQRLLHAPEPQRAELIQTLTSIEQSEEDDELTHSPVRAANIEDFDFFDPNLKSQSLIAYSSCGALIDNTRIVNQRGEVVNILKRGEIYTYQYRVSFHETVNMVRGGAMIKTITGLEISGLQSHPENKAIPIIASGEVVKFSFDFRCSLLPGTYFLNAGVVGKKDGVEAFLHRIVDALVFRVVNEENINVVGIVDLGIDNPKNEVVTFIEPDEI